MKLRCSLCRRSYPIHTQEWRCECGGVFELEGTAPFSREEVRPDVPTLWRYRALLPVDDDEDVVSLGEGLTPLVQIRISERSVLCKLEFLAPTGSFKDRGTAVLVSVLRGLGVEEVVEDSSGNAAASLAAYCANAGMHARIFVPAHASPAKLAQITVYGAEVVRVEGPRENAALAAQEAARNSYYASHSYNPFFVQGTKTFAYELWEHLGEGAPDNLVVPLGNGSLLMGASLGFTELQAAGLVERMPRLIAVQANACAPFYEAYRQGLEHVPPVLPGETIAEGIHVAHPTRGRQVLRAIRATGGAIVAVDDNETLEARNMLASKGLYVEPTSATAVAALRRLDGLIARHDVTVLALTGSGLKSP